MLLASDQIEGLSQLATLQAAMAASGDIVYEWNLENDALQWFGAATQFLTDPEGCLPSSGEAFQGLINPEDFAVRLRALSDHFAHQNRAPAAPTENACDPVPYDCEYRVRGRDGAFIWVHDRGAAQFSAGGAPQSLVGVLRVVTARKDEEVRLRFLANYDELTGHYNKARLREALEHAVSQAARYHQPGCYLAVGVDQLGMINTAYGFEIGDAVLMEVAQRLDRCLRGTDVIGRPGSDRFGVILASTSLSEAQEAANRILESLRAAPMTFNGIQLSVTASIGLVCFPDQSRTSFDVMTKAENAMMEAKNGGRDRLCLYRLTDEQQQHYRESMEIGEEIKQALRDNRLILAHQPVVHAATGETAYFESLIRLSNLDGSLIPAGSFIPVVEQLGLMPTIDRYVLKLAIQELEAHPHATLAINISGLTATDRSWLRLLTSLLKGRAGVAKRLIVEITETAALQDIDESARFVSAVQHLGCRIALDDFGAGYTTFRHIKALTVDVVKIDGSFIRDITHSPENQAFVNNLLSLARTLGLKTVAEYVETEEVAAFLRKLGVDYMQGYHFGKPEINPAWPAETTGKPARSVEGNRLNRIRKV